MVIGVVTAEVADGGWGMASPPWPSWARRIGRVDLLDHWHLAVADEDAGSVPVIAVDGMEATLMPEHHANRRQHGRCAHKRGETIDVFPPTSGAKGRARGSSTPVQ